MAIDWKQTLLDAVAHRPQAIAVHDRSSGVPETCTYQEFAERVGELQEMIGATTPAKGRVAILLPAGTNCVAAFWAAACAERCYIPLFADLGLDRVREILVDTDPHLVLVSSDRHDDLKAILNVTGHGPAESTERGVATYRKEGSLEHDYPEALSVILFTSGSTGVPKGIVHSRRTISAAVSAFIEAHQMGPEDKLFATIPPHFDAATYDIFATLAVGGELIIPEKNGLENPRELCRVLDETRATVMPAVPTILRLLMSYGKPERFSFAKMRSVQPGGEILSEDFARKLMNVFPNAVITNMFGPAEIITSNCFHIPRDFFEKPRASVPIGPSFGTGEFKIREDGELLITGEQLMLGYWKNAALTSEKISVEDGKRWYATGDIAAIDDEGYLQFKGRRDRMVKRWGVRTELDDVQRNVEKLPGVVESGVVAIADPRQGCRIIAHVCLADSAVRDALSLRQEAQRLLPSELVPDKFEVHKELPRTTTGKVDLQRLIGMG